MDPLRLYLLSPNSCGIAGELAFDTALCTRSPAAGGMIGRRQIR